METGIKRDFDEMIMPMKAEFIHEREKCRSQLNSQY